MAKKKELQPREEERNIALSKKDMEQLRGLVGDAASSISIDDEQDADSFFKNVITQLMNNKEPSTKTEYLNVNENFAGAKLTFLARYGNIPYLNEFVNIFETKRISLERKGRKELLMSLLERQQEMERQKAENLRNMLGL